MNRVHCTAEHPATRESMADPYVTLVVHSEVDEVGEQEDGWPGGDIVTYRCRNCGHRWRSELPQ